MLRIKPLKILGIIADIIEIYIPSIAFVTMFLTFVIQIFFRYFLNNPLTWPYEVTVFGFIWTALFGALYAKRKNSHVKFTLLYDHMSPGKQLIIRLTGNLLLLISFIMGFYPAYDYIMFLAYQKSTVLFIPYNIAYFPYLVFMAGIIIRLILDIIADVRIINHPELQEGVNR